MQRVLLVLNLLLLVAVGYLLMDKFSGSSAKPETPEEQIGTSNSGVGTHIVYVNVDTLLNNYELFKARQKSISEREQQEDARLRTRGKSLEREIMALQEKAAGGTMTPKDLKLEEERLMRKQQEFLADQERITKQLMEESTRINDELQAEIVRVIRSLKTDEEYDFVLSYGIGSPVLAVNDKLDITDVVLRELNKQAAGNKQ